MARRKVDTTEPLEQVADRLSTAAASAVAEADPTPDALENAQEAAQAPAQPRKRRGRPPGSGRRSKAAEEAAAAAEAAREQTRAMLAMVAGSLGETLIHGLGKVESPRWEYQHADAVAQLWAPVVHERLTSSDRPETVAIYGTIGIVLPFAVAALRNAVESRRAAQNGGKP